MVGMKAEDEESSILEILMVDTVTRDTLVRANLPNQDPCPYAINEPRPLADSCKMARLAVFLLFAAAPLVFCGPLNHQFLKHKADYKPAVEGTGSADPGTPLFLTPYIDNNQIDTGIRVLRT